MKTIPVGRGWAKRLISEKRALLGPGQGWRYVVVGSEIGEIEVLVDVDALVGAIGVRALKSKRGISKIQGGAVTLRVVSRRRVAEGGSGE